MRLLLGRTARYLGSVTFPDGEVEAVVKEALDSARKGRIVRESALVTRIEAQRKAWLKRTDRMNDGTLGAEPFTAALTVREAVEASKLAECATLLYRLIEWRRPEVVVEFGTNIGISTAWQAAALQENGTGHLHTMELSPYRVRFAEVALKEFGFTNLTLHNVDFDVAIEADLPGWGPVDFAFVDGDHMRDTTIRYFERLVELAAPGAILVFDDIDWSDGMREAWTTIKDSEASRFTCDFLGMGIVLLR